MSRVPTVPRVQYLAGAAISYYAVWWEWLITLTMTPLCSTRLGKFVFVWLSRSPVKVRNITLVVLVISQMFLFRKAFAINFVLLCALQSFQFANFYKRRVLTIANRGAGYWTVHLNALSRERGSAAGLWAGMSEELSELAAFARAAGVRTLVFDSPLLVDDTTAKIVASRLDKIFGHQGLVANVTVEQRKPMGAFKSGFFRPMRRHQVGLKAHRVITFSSGELMTRRIQVNLTRAT